MGGVSSPEEAYSDIGGLTLAFEVKALFCEINIDHDLCKDEPTPPTVSHGFLMGDKIANSVSIYLSAPLSLSLY